MLLPDISCRLRGFHAGENGMEVVRLEGADGYCIFVAPERGGDIVHLVNPAGRQAFSCPIGPVNGHWAAILSHLTDRLKVLGPGFTAYGHIGAPNLFHPLHGAWTHTPGWCVGYGESAGSQKLTLRFEYDETFTVAEVGVSFTVDRHFAVHETQYTLSDDVRMTRDCCWQGLHHPNEVMLSGDRLVLPWDRVRSWVARDGNTAVNPFRPADDVGERADEECYFGKMEPMDHPDNPNMKAYPGLIVGVDGRGVGQVYMVHKSSPPDTPSNIVYWRNPGYGSQAFEFGDLPVGRAQAIKLGLLNLYKQGEIICWGYQQVRLNSPEEVVGFADKWGLDLGCVPRSLSGMIPGWDERVL